MTEESLPSPEEKVGFRSRHLMMIMIGIAVVAIAAVVIVVLVVAGGNPTNMPAHN